MRMRGGEDGNANEGGGRNDELKSERLSGFRFEICGFSDSTFRCFDEIL
jgi:hypothetical protein